MSATMMIYNNFIDRVARGQTDLDAGLTVKGMLLAAGYTPSQTHDFRDDLTNEVTGTGYSAGGGTASVTVATVGGSNLTRLTLGSIVWSATGGTLTGRKVAYYVSRGGAASADELICVVSESADVTATNASWTAAAQVIEFINQNAS
jgi:hypothetical protein